MLIEKVARTITRHQMIRPGDRLLVALSGGPDSVALSAALLELARRTTSKAELRLAHLDHGIRPDAGRDEAFCAELAHRLGLPFTSKRIDLRVGAGTSGGSVETRARAARYRFLEETARKWDCSRIAVGHTMDDQAETVLFRLLRGAGTAGLGAMRPVTGPVIRPLLEVRRSEVLDFLHARKLSYLVDPTNLDGAFSRNRIRHLDLPRLEEHHNPNLVETLARTAELLQEEDDWMEEETSEALSALVTSPMPRPGTDPARRVSLDSAQLQALPPALRRRVVRRAIGLTKGDLRDVTSQHVDAVLALSESGKSGRRVSLPGLLGGRSFDDLWLDSTASVRGHGASKTGGRPTDGNPQRKGYNGEDYEYLLAVPGRLSVPEAGGSIRVEETWSGPPPVAAGSSVVLALDPDGAELRVRSYRPGDRFRPLGAPGSKSVSRYLMERRVQWERRGRVPVVVSRSQGIVWVVGHGVSEAMRVKPESKRLLRMSWLAT